MIHLELHATDGAARAGTIHTARGEIPTPIFMPVGTQATVKAMTPEELEQLGARIILGNTYHLHLRPGEDVVRKLGGLHRFMHWDRPILTDSGGFQIFSLPGLAKVREEGVAFQSHIDGRHLMLGPEDSIAVQEALGSDIMMCLDHLVPGGSDAKTLEEAVARTTRWAQRCKEARRGTNALFAIVQGGTNPAMRTRSAQELLALDMDGYAIGGLSVGEAREAMYDAIAHTAPLLPADKPRYLMGTGEPEELLRAVAEGVDMFDCVLPTRNARNGTLYTPDGRVNIKQARFREDPAPLQADCPCPACRHYSRAYLAHIFRAREILSMRLNTWHNLTFFLGLMAQARVAIMEGRFAAFHADFLERYRGKQI